MNNHKMPNYQIDATQEVLISTAITEAQKDVVRTENNVEDLKTILREHNVTLKMLAIKHRGIEGGYLKKSDGGNVIFVDKDLPTGKKVFVVAHELGHMFLHKKDMADEEVKFRDLDKTKDKEEIEAHEFAGRLLMPEDQIRSLLSSEGEYIGDSVVGYLSRKFNVTKTAVKVRLRNLDFKTSSLY